ncbi:unnamed protein product, partial [Ascophyllum nodosum]
PSWPQCTPGRAQAISISILAALIERTSVQDSDRPRRSPWYRDSSSVFLQRHR